MKVSLEDAAKIIKSNGTSMVSVLLGPSGCGKTAVLVDLAGGLPEEGGRACVLPAPLMVIDEFNLFSPPLDGTDNVKALLSPRFTDLFEVAKLNPKKMVLCIIDELPQGSADVQLAMCSLMYDRVINGHMLPKNVAIVATGNRREHCAGAGAGFSHLTNRIQRLDIDHDPDSWCAWAMGNGVRPDVLAFIKSKETALYLNTDPTSDTGPEIEAKQYRAAARDWVPFPSERAWTRASGLVDRYEKAGLSTDLIAKAVGGVIGEVRAQEYIATREIVSNIPSRPDLLEGRADWPTDPLTSWACCIREAQMVTPGTFEKTIKAMKEAQPELVQCFVTCLQQKLKASSNPNDSILNMPGLDKLLGGETRYGRSMG